MFLPNNFETFVLGVVGPLEESPGLPLSRADFSFPLDFNSLDNSKAGIKQDSSTVVVFSCESSHATS